MDLSSADRKDADDELNKTLDGVSVSNVSGETSEVAQSTKPQRNRKKKSYGTEFEEDDSGTEESDGMFFEC